MASSAMLRGWALAAAYVALAEVVGTQAAGKPGGAAGRQHVAWAGAVVTEGNGSERPQEHRADVFDFFRERFGVAGLHVKVFGRQFVDTVDGRVLVRGQHERTVPLQAIAGHVAPSQLG